MVIFPWKTRSHRSYGKMRRSAPLKPSSGSSPKFKTHWVTLLSENINLSMCSPVLGWCRQEMWGTIILCQASPLEGAVIANYKVGSRQERPVINCIRFPPGRNVRVFSHKIIKISSASELQLVVLRKLWTSIFLITPDFSPAQDSCLESLSIFSMPHNNNLSTSTVASRHRDLLSYSINFWRAHTISRFLSGFA